MGFSNPTELLRIIFAEPEIENQDGGHYTGSTYISACRKDRNAISTPKPMFAGFSNPTELQRIFSQQTGGENSTWLATKSEALID